MEITIAEQKDIDAIKKLSDSSLKISHSREYFKRRLNSFFYLAKKDGRIVGFIIAQGLTLLLLVVDKKLRRAGIATSLVNFAFGHFPQLYLKVRESNTGAINFYEKSGWEYRGKAPLAFRNGEAGLIFTKFA